MSAPVDVLGVIGRELLWFSTYQRQKDLLAAHAAVAELLAAAHAAIAYDAAIQRCANDPASMSSFCTAQGDDLDTLYDDWISKSRVAIAKATGATP